MAFFERYTVEGKFDGVNWVDFKRDIVSDITGAYGILTSDGQIRVADIGWMSFELNNAESNSGKKMGYYSPGHANCRGGFYPGMEIRLTFTLSGRRLQKWIGKIAMDGIRPVSGRYGIRRTQVKAVDWMQQVTDHELKGIEYATNKDLMDGVALVLENMDIQPPGEVNYRTAESDFSALFDTVQANTSALAEIAKMVNSELGYFYPTRQGLRVEGRLTRNTEKLVLDAYLKAKADLDTLINEDGDHIVDETGARILLSDSDTAIFEDAQRDADITFGTNYFNEVSFVSYPRRVDANADTVLFELARPMEIQAGETIVIASKYKDPTGVAKSVSGIDMVTPEAGNHYSANSAQDGTGDDLTANITVTAIFGTGGFSYEITNSGAEGWITICKAVGRGIYTDQAVEYTVEDATGIERFGKKTLRLDMKYQDDPTVARYWSRVKLFQFATLRTYINSATYQGVRAEKYLYAFLYLEPGDRIRIGETVTGVEDDYFIQGVEFRISTGGALEFKWHLKAAGLDTWNFVVWDGDGTWDDTVYGWDF